MGRPRVNQMAKDLGMTRRQALDLMNKSRKTKDAGSSALLRVLKKYDRELADRIAQEDTEMVLKRKEGGGTPVPEMPKEGLTKARLRNKLRKEGMDDNQIDIILKNPDMLSPDHPMNKENNRLKRRGDDEPVIKAGHGMAFQAEPDYSKVRGMGKAYMGNPRPVKSV